MNELELEISATLDYVEEAAFLWLQRAAAVRAPNYTLALLAKLDERLEAHIDGLRVAGAEGWQAAADALAGGGPDSLFPAAVLALEAQDGRFETLLDRLKDAPHAAPGLISALGWCEATRIGPTVQALLRHDDPRRRLLGVAACGVHRINPGARLDEALTAQAGPVRARALRTAGELGATDLLPQVLACLGDRNVAARFWAAWSGVLLGDRALALRALCGEALKPGMRQLDALRLALAALTPEAGHDLLQRLPESVDRERLLVIGAGLIGAPRYIPWLLARMASPQLARVAAEAFMTITGIDFNLEQAEVPPPDGYAEGPTDDPDDEDVLVPEDVALPWLDPKCLGDWWNEHGAALAAQPTLFLGGPATQSRCQAVVRSGWQRQRRLAALRLCLLSPGTSLFNVSAPAHRQRAVLEVD